MTNPQIQNDPIYQLPFLYINGLLISNDATTPHTILDIAAGQCRDSNDVMDMTVGVTNANIQGNTVSAPLLLNAAINGVNGLDTGTFAEATMYAIYLIGDSRYYKTTACIATLASNSQPLMPFGYDSFRLIGYWNTQTGNAYWSVGYMSYAQGGNRQFVYDAPYALTLAGSGAATTYATGATALTNIVPAINNLPVSLAVSFIPGNAAGDTVKFQGGNSTGDAVTITGQVTTVHVTENITVLSQLVTGVPTVNYKVTNAGDTASATVAGFQVSI